MMASNKIIGYILLALGLAIIVGALYQSYNIFTAKASAPLVFKTILLQKNVSSGTPQQQFEQIMQKQIGEVLPADTVNKALNLLSWSLLAGILIFGGAKISGIGVKMIGVA